MPEGPLGGPRPLARTEAELNTFFSLEDAPITKDTVRKVKSVADSNVFISPPAEGPFGAEMNAVSVSVGGNSMTKSALREIENQMENETGMTVDDIEVIW